MILGNLVAEAVFAVVVYGRCGMNQAVDRSGIFFRELIARFFFHEPEENRFEPQAGFAKHFFGESEERSSEIAAAAVDTDNRSRQKHDLSIFYYFIVFQVDCDMCPSASAKIDGTPFQFPQALHNWRQVFVHSGNERFMKYG